MDSGINKRFTPGSANFRARNFEKRPPRQIDLLEASNLGSVIKESKSKRNSYMQNSLKNSSNTHEFDVI